MTAPLNFLPERAGTPRLLFIGDEYELRVAYAGEEESLATGLAEVFHPTPSLDGLQLAFVELGAEESLSVVDVKTGERRRLLQAEHFDENLYWLTGGRLLVNDCDRWRICDTRTGRVGGPVDPSGERIATELDHGMAVVRLDGRVELQGPPGWPWSWSPDGRLVVYSTVEGVGHRINVWDTKTNQHRALTSVDESCYWPSFTADGLHVVVDHTPGPRGSGHVGRIARLRLTMDGSLTFLTTGPADERPVCHRHQAWLAWGRRDVTNRHRVNICTMGPEGRVTEIRAPGAEACWWPT